MAFARVPAVVGEIEQIVEQVASRRAGRQGREHPRRHQVQPGLGLVRGDEGHEHQRILDPLVRAQGPEAVERTAAGSGEKPGVFVQRPYRPRETGREVDTDGVPRMFPHRQVAPLVADVIEPALAEVFDQSGGLGLAGQIGAPVRGEAACRPNGLGERSDRQLVGGGSQPDLASRGPGGGDLLEHGRVQHQRRRRQRHPAGDPAFERGASAGQPEGQGEQGERGGGDQPGRALDQQIAADQRAVDVHDQRRRDGILRDGPGTGWMGFTGVHHGRQARVRPQVPVVSLWERFGIRVSIILMRLREGAGAGRGVRTTRAVPILPRLPESTMVVCALHPLLDEGPDG